MKNNDQLNRIESDLDILKTDLIMIKRSLKELVEFNKKDEITFKVEGDKLIGNINSIQKRQFRKD